MSPFGKNWEDINGETLQFRISFCSCGVVQHARIRRADGRVVRSWLSSFCSRLRRVERRSGSSPPPASPASPTFRVVRPINSRINAGMQSLMALAPAFFLDFGNFEFLPDYWNSKEDRLPFTNIHGEKPVLPEPPNLL
jgi:hypothetical protein